MSGFEKFKEELPSKKQFYSCLTGENISDKEHQYVIKVQDRSQMKMTKDYPDFYLKRNVLLLAYVLKNYG